MSNIQLSAFEQNRWLDHMTFLTALRDAVGGAIVVQALFATAEQEWASYFDVNDPDSHLIRGVFTSSQKTDAVQLYIGKLVAQYMNSHGVRVTAWTKATIASENFTNVAISNRIAAHQFEINYDLFKIVVTRLLGFDDGLIDFALTGDSKHKARMLVAYLGQRFDLGPDAETILADHPDAVVYFEDLFETEGALTADWFEQVALNIGNYPHKKVKDNFLDMLPVFEKYHYSFQADPADTNIPLTISKLLERGYEKVTCGLPKGETILVRAGDGPIEKLPSLEQRQARFALKLLHGEDIYGPNIDPVATLAQVREDYLLGVKSKQYVPGEAIAHKVAEVDTPHDKAASARAEAFSADPQLHDALSTAQRSGPQIVDAIQGSSLVVKEENKQ